jgi:hypothetical protein
MNITIRVERNGETADVKTNLYIMIMWERKYKKRASDLANGIGYEDLTFFAYEASKLAGLTVPVSMDDYAKTITLLEVVDNEPTNPTQAGLIPAN